MSATTALTLATGQRYELTGDYEAITATLAARPLTETGTRELTTTEGSRITIAIGAIASIEESTGAASSGGTLGFSRALEAA